MAAPFLSQPIASRDNVQRGQVQLDDALAFRMPGSLLGGRPRGAGDSVPGGGNRGGVAADPGAFQFINSASPTPISSATASRSHVRGGAVMNKNGNGWQKLGAVKLASTPPGSRQERCRRISCSPRRTRGGDSSSRDCSPSSLSPLSGAGGSRRGRRGQRGSIHVSPCRYKKGDSNDDGDRATTSAVSTSPKRQSMSALKILEGAATTVVAAAPANGDGVGRSSNTNTSTSRNREESISTCPKVVVEGSRIDLRALDRAKVGTSDRPRAYQCADGSIVVLGRERMLSVQPEAGESPGAGKGWGSAEWKWGGLAGEQSPPGRSSGVVTWVLRYAQLESCCVNVSAGHMERSVGDVVVEVTAR